MFFVHTYRFRKFCCYWRYHFVVYFAAVIVFFSALFSPVLASIDQEMFIISSCEDLQNISHNLSGNYKIAKNIDCSDTRNWNDGAGFTPIENFNGTLEGNNHTIFNLYINNIKQGNVGLFSSTTNEAVIKDLTLTNVDIKSSAVTGRTASLVAVSYSSQISNVHVMGDVTVTGNYPIGGLVAHNGGGKIVNSSFVGTVNTVGGFAGGLVATNDLDAKGKLGEITNSYAEVNVNGQDRIGGLVANNYGLISNSYATGNIVGRAGVGGLVGTNSVRTASSSDSDGTISNSYAASGVSGDFDIGGLVGSTSSGAIKDSYVAGRVNGNSNVGGLIGDTDKTTVISDSYYDTDISDQSDTDKGTPKTTAEMMQQKTFIGWDFENVWKIKEDKSYPELRWQ